MPTRPPGIPTLDLTTDGSFGALDGVVFATAQVQPAGTGNFNTFVQIQHTGVEQGYNTDGGTVLDDKTTFNHSILLAQIPIVIGDGANGTTEGVAYREFLLDINEGNSGTNPYLSLDKLQIWQEESGSLTNLGTTGFSGSHTNHLVYSLDANTDQWVAINDALSSGSGHSDIAVLVPDSYFTNDAADRFVYLYSEFGVQSGWGADAGAEQWGLSVPNGPNVATNALAISKTVSIPEQDHGTADRVGEVLTYTVHVDNVGNTTLTHLVVTDPAATGFAPVLSAGFNVGDTNHNGVFNAGESWVYTGTHTVTQADLDNNGDGDGFITNTATADTDQTTPQSATTQVVVVQNSGLEVTKTPSVTSVDAAGQVITYDIAVTNTGTVTQTIASVTDTDVQAVTPILDFSAPIVDLNVPLEGPILVGDYNIGDLNQNGIEDPGETFQFANFGDTNQNGIQDPGEIFSFANVGDTNHNGQQDAGETFQYYNAGDTNKNGVQDAGETFQFNFDHNATPVLSGGFNVGDANHNGVIDPGETWHFSATYTLTQDDIDNGGVVDPALAHHDDATASNGQTSATGSASVNVIQNPVLTVTKAADVGSVDAAGDVIHYTVTVSSGANNGNMTLTNVTVSDPFVTNLAYASGDTDGDGKLDLTETWTYTGSHTVTQAEIDNNGVVDPGLQITNTATADTAQTDPQTASAAVDVIQNPVLTVSKAADVSSVDAAGDVIHYTVTVSSGANNGNMTLTGISVSDPFVPDLAYSSGDANSDGKLDLTETWTYTGTHTVSQAEIDNNGVVDPSLSIDNTVTADSTQTSPQTASASVSVVQDPEVTLAKTATIHDGGASVDAVGDVIDYTLALTNSGNMTLTNPVVSDPSTSNLAPVLNAGHNAGDANGNDLLDLGETWQYTASHTVTQTDLEGGPTLSNTASASTDQGASATATASVPVSFTAHPGLTLVETPVGYHDLNHDNIADIGDTIVYHYIVTNTGNVTLHDVGVNDQDGTVAYLNNLLPSLAPGVADSTTVTATHVINNQDTGSGSFDHESVANALEVGNAIATSHAVLANLTLLP